MLRVLRSLRIIRVLRFFREMRLILLSLMGCCVPLLWALLCLAMIVFVFSVFFLQGVAEFLEAASPGNESVDVNSLIAFFETFLQTFLTLIMAITGGDDWGSIERPLAGAAPFYGVGFVIYIAIMIFGTLNVITGIFVEGAIQKARSDRELKLAAEVDRHRNMIRQLMHLFKELDDDESGTITFEEWDGFTRSKDAKAALALLGLDVARTNDIFQLIDLDNSSEIDLREFVVGCMQLQGSAQSVDVETLLRNNKKLLVKCTEHFAKVEQHIDEHMAERFAKMDAQMRRLEQEIRGHWVTEQRVDEQMAARLKKIASDISRVDKPITI
jgi:hypothetical protein